MTTTTRPTHSPATRYLPLFTFQRTSRLGRIHLAKVKSTKQPVTEAWCGRTFFVDPAQPVITGHDAVLLAWHDEQPTCALCLARVGAWEW